METFKLLFPYCMIGFALVVVTVFSAIFMLSNKIADLRTWLALSLTATFIACCIATMAVIIGNGNGTMKFEASLLKWLGGATIAEVAGIVIIVFRFFFNTTEDTAKVAQK